MGAAMQIVVGLGNPGERYVQTRHNAGFWWIDGLARRYGAQFKAAGRFHGDVADVRSGAGGCKLLKPTTFMNHSGRAVSALANFYRVPTCAILVVHDEIDLPPGTIRLKQGGGDGGHRGLRNIIPALGRDFLRLRIGVGRPEHSRDVIEFVLKRPRAEERSLIDAALERSLGYADDILAGHAQRVMNELHRQPAPVSC